METNKTKEFIIRRDCFGNIYTQTEFVRCKDCKYGTKFTKPFNKDYEIYCENQRINPAFVNPDWFCGDGEK